MYVRASALREKRGDNRGDEGEDVSEGGEVKYRER